jgi:hypothetical protein
MGQHKEEHGMKKILMVTLAAALLLGAFAPAVAADQPEKDWRWDLAPLYGWFISVSGDITVNDRQGTIDLDFGDIFDNLDFIFTAHAEGVYQQRWGLWIDYSYVDLSKTVETLGPALDVGFTDNLSEGAAFYRFVKGVHTFGAPGSGGRHGLRLVGRIRRPAVEVDLLRPVDAAGAGRHRRRRVRLHLERHRSYRLAALEARRLPGRVPRFRVRLQDGEQRQRPGDRPHTQRAGGGHQLHLVAVRSEAGLSPEGRQAHLNLVSTVVDERRAVIL